MRRLTLHACAVLLVAGGLQPGTASAQELRASATTDATGLVSESVARIQAEIVALRRQIDALSPAGTAPDLLAALRSQLEALERQLASFTEPNAQSAQPAQPAAQAPTALQQQQLQDVQTDRDAVSGDQISVARIDNRTIDKTRANFIDLPGTDAGFQLGGYAKLDMIVDPRLAGNIDKFVSSTIPVGVPDDGQYSNFNVHARQTRFQLNFIKGTQKTVGGPLRFYLEADFFGSDGPLAFRMRHAYGSKANVVAGFTWSALTDPDAYPDTLDFEMVPGTTQNRQPQFRYTVPFGVERNTSLAFSIEKPTTDVALVGDTSVVTRYPDVIVRFRHNWTGGHIQTGAAFRSLGASDRLTTTDTTFGIAGTATAAFPVGGDLVTLGVIGGPGAAHYISTISGIGLDASIDVLDREIEAVTSYGAHAGYKHNWTDRMRTTVAYGFNNVEDNEFLSPTAVESNHVFTINFIRKFGSAATTGIEYDWGDNQLMNGEDGWAQRIQFSIKYDLTK